MTRVIIPGPLQSYTHAREVSASGNSLGSLLQDLDVQYPGIRFRMVDEQERIRPHMRVFVNGEQVFGLDHTISAADSIQIVQALSGG